MLSGRRRGGAAAVVLIVIGNLRAGCLQSELNAHHICPTESPYIAHGGGTMCTALCTRAPALVWQPLPSSTAACFASLHAPMGARHYPQRRHLHCCPRAVPNEMLTATRATIFRCLRRKPVYSRCGSSYCGARIDTRHPVLVNKLVLQAVVTQERSECAPQFASVPAGQVHMRSRPLSWQMCLWIKQTNKWVDGMHANAALKEFKCNTHRSHPSSLVCAPTIPPYDTCKLCHAHSHNPCMQPPLHTCAQRKNARCLLGMWGVRVGATLVSSSTRLSLPSARSAAWRSSRSLRSHASTTCSSLVPGVLSSGSTVRSPPAVKTASRGVHGAGGVQQLAGLRGAGARAGTPGPQASRLPQAPRLQQARQACASPCRWLHRLHASNPAQPASCPSSPLPPRAGSPLASTPSST